MGDVQCDRDERDEDGSADVSKQYADLDDSVAAALAALTGQEFEHIGLVYQDENGVKSTPPQTTQRSAKVKANIIIPKGSLRALFHNHPTAKGDQRSLRSVGGGEKFSEDDIAQARKLGVPSYILTPSGRVLMFDPTTNKTTEVLAQIPVRSSGAHNTIVK